MWTYRPGLEELPVYNVEESDWSVKLDANESPFNLPPRVAERVQDRLACLAFNRYPDLGKMGLREMLAESYGLAVEEVQVGGGSSEILAAICHALGGPGRSIVYPTPSFSMYGIYAKITDSVAVPVALNEQYQLDAAKVLQAARENNAALILLCNPNNPTGSFIPEETLLRFLENCPPETLVVMDEAYALFADAEGFASALKWRDRFPNLIVLETFSKAFGLAGLRVGYGIAHPEVASSIMKVRLPFHISRLSVAAALAALDDEEFLQKTLENNRRGKAFLLREIEATGFRVIPSQANFLLFLPPRDPIALVKAMERRGVIVRSLVAFGVPEGIRVTVGTEEQNNIFLKAFKEAVKEVYHG